MNKKVNVILSVLVTSCILLGCGQQPSITGNFVEYDSQHIRESDDLPRYSSNIEDKTLANYIPRFTFKHPPDWEYGWFADMGIYYFVIVSGDLDAAQSSLDSGVQMIIIPYEYSGEDLTDLLFFAPDGLEPSSTTINGQEAVRVEFAEDQQLKIELMIVREKWGLDVLAEFPSEKEKEYRPLLEEIIKTIEIK